jgi:hypothetical protein
VFVSSRPDRLSDLLDFEFRTRCAQAALRAPGRAVYAPALARMRDRQLRKVSTYAPARCDMNRNTEPRDPEKERPDVEMQAIGYPPPVDPASFAQKLSDIIKRGVRTLGRRAKGNE